MGPRVGEGEEREGRRTDVCIELCVTLPPGSLGLCVHAGSKLRLSVHAKSVLLFPALAEVNLVFCGRPLPPQRPLPPLAAAASDKKCVLSLDGGGLYAAVGQLVMLLQLEKEVRSLLSDEKAPLAGCFDLIVGTGAGGLVALSLLKGSSLSDMLKQWVGVGGPILTRLSSKWRQSLFARIAAGEGAEEEGKRRWPWWLASPTLRALPPIF
ncbi:hypothetical protein Efla_002926 [Eimeria flavescens]